MKIHFPDRSGKDLLLAPDTIVLAWDIETTKLPLKLCSSGVEEITGDKGMCEELLSNENSEGGAYRTKI